MYIMFIDKKIDDLLSQIITIVILNKNKTLFILKLSYSNKYLYQPKLK